jgi:hypothetical protein
MIGFRKPRITQPKTSPRMRVSTGTERVKTKNCTTLSTMPGIRTRISFLHKSLRSLLQLACHLFTASELRTKYKTSALAVPTGAVTTNLRPFGSVTGNLTTIPACHWKRPQAPQASSHTSEKTTHNLRKPWRQFIVSTTANRFAERGHFRTDACSCASGGISTRMANARVKLDSSG